MPVGRILESHCQHCYHHLIIVFRAGNGEHPRSFEDTLVGGWMPVGQNFSLVYIVIIENINYKLEDHIVIALYVLFDARCSSEDLLIQLKV